MEDSVLVELVARHPCLYDLKHRRYKDVHLKDDVWREISEVMNQSTEECKKRWKNIRDTYNRRKKNKKEGTATKKSAKWVLADILSFLDKVDYEKIGASNDQDNSNYSANFDETSNHNIKEELNMDDIEQVLVRCSPSEFGDYSRDNHGQSDSQEETCTRKRHNSTTFDPIDGKKAKADPGEPSLSEGNKELEHPVDVFMKSMAMSIKRLSKKAQIKAKNEICRLVGDLEMQEFDAASQS